MESKIGLEVLSDLANETLEGELSDEKLGGLLVLSDLTKSDCSWSVSVRLLHSTGCRGTLASSFRGELLAWSLSTSGFASGLLGTCHDDVFFSVAEGELMHFEFGASFRPFVDFD